MKIETLFRMLRDQGFTIDRTAREIYYKTERVGDFGYGEDRENFGSDYVRLCVFQPSLIGEEFRHVHKNNIDCDDPSADIKLLETILDFKNTPRRYEEKCRLEKIVNVKKYFENREIGGAQ